MMLDRKLPGSNPVSTGRIVFVMGCGRSGTHWLGYILTSHQRLLVTVEKSNIFDAVTRMAMDSGSISRLMPKLSDAYDTEIRRAGALLYADKSHPTLWISEQLAGLFPNARFVGIQRSPYATVASMIRHGAVSRRTQKWRNYPVPNPFLGITEANCDKYDNLSLASKHALRWKSHADRMDQLRSVLDGRMHFIQYESLHLDMDAQLADLASFLDMAEPFPQPEVREHSLERWRTDLSKQEIHDIAYHTAIHPPVPADRA